jgi:hypothetical protein
MGIFDKIRGAFSSEKAQKIEKKGDYPLWSELRLHARYFVLSPELACLEIVSNGMKGTIKDLSYGGALVEFPESWDSNPKNPAIKSFDAKLTFLDQTCNTFVHLTHVRSDGNLVGLSFVHRNIETLVFLREILENLRVGSTLEVLNPSVLKEKHLKPGALLYRGDGPCDLTFQEAGENIESMLFTFRMGLSYFELKYENHVFSTARSSSDDQREAPKMEPSPNGVDLVILRNAIQILLGFLATHQNSKVTALMPKLYSTLYGKKV